MQETVAFDKNKMQSKPDSDKPWQMLWFFYMSTNCFFMVLWKFTATI